jgi:hypothetical protein
VVCLSENTHSKQILVMAETIKISSAERQSAKVLLNALQQRLCTRRSQRDSGCICNLCVMTALHVLSDVALSGGAKGLNGKCLALFHLGLIASLYDRHALCSVDGPLSDVVAVQVANTLDREGLASDLALVRFHSFLDGGANVGHADVDAGFSDTSICGVLDGCQQVVVGGVEGHGEGTVDDATVDVGTEIDLHDISLLEDGLVAGVGSVVGGAVVDAQTSGETHASSDVVALLETLMAGQVTYAILDALSDFGKRLTGLDVLLGPLADLSVDFGGVAVLGQVVVAHAIEMSLLLVGGAVRVVVNVLADLSFGERAIGEELGNGDSRRVGLALCGSTAGLLLLSGLSLLLFLCGTFFGSVIGTFSVVGIVVRVFGVGFGTLLCFGSSTFGQVALGLLH